MHRRKGLLGRGGRGRGVNELAVVLRREMVRATERKLK